MSKRKPKKTKSDLAREKHAADPYLTDTEIGADVGLTRQAVAAALGRSTRGPVTGGKRGRPLKAPLCPACAGTGRVMA